MLDYKIKRYGESALIIHLKEEISIEVAQIVDTVILLINRDLNKWIEFEIASYCSITIGFDHESINYNELKLKIESLLTDVELSNTQLTKKIYNIPICYDDSFALDIEKLEKQLKLDRMTIQRLHVEKTYYVFLMGFLPGFGYLGPISEQLACKRLETPRKSIPKGSVGIAGQQTGIYPMDSPGGWNIIGRCPINLFDYESHNPILLNRGDIIKFHSITLEEYGHIISNIEACIFNNEVLLES